MSENQKISANTIQLTSFCFNILLNDLLAKLEADNPGILNNKVSQIFGFGTYDQKKSSLKKELDTLSGLSLNGKYIYDKKRELSSGKPFIKLNKPYNHILFEYLGYETAVSYIHEKLEDEQEKKKQLNLILLDKKTQPHYYVSYHFGEYKEIVKSEVTVKDDWKRIEYNYVYPQDDGTFKYFLYYGDIKKRNDALHIQTRTFLDGKMVPSGENIVYIGYGDPAKSKFLLGVFSAFDINNKLIAVKTIQEKCMSKEEMIEKSHQAKVPGYIAQELRNQRIENDITIPNNKMEISLKSPYYSTYEKIAGTYIFQFETNQKENPEIHIHINPDNYKISSIDPGILINKDDIQLIHNASILNIRLHLSGLTPFLQLDINIKTYYLKDNTKTTGKYNGIDFENCLVSGDVVFTYKPS